MNGIKRYLIGISSMLMISIFSILIIGILTYQFKWYADKAMIGIILTYIAAGFTGGFCLRKIEKKEYGREQRIGMRKNMIEALTLSTVFMLILILCSGLVAHIPFEFSTRFLLIWMLVASSALWGKCVKR